MNLEAKNNVFEGLLAGSMKEFYTVKRKPFIVLSANSPAFKQVKHSKGISLLLEGSLLRGGGSVPGGCLVRVGGLLETPPVTTTAAGGTHPTGMHSFSSMNFLVKRDFFLFCFLFSLLLKFMAV